MWKYIEQDAWDIISLHDCRSGSVSLKNGELVFSFPDGFWILPGNCYNTGETPAKTGPAQLCFQLFFEEEPFDAVDLFKTTYLFGKSVLCRRLQPEPVKFLQYLNSADRELEFSTEYHVPLTVLYQCWVWKKSRGVDAECQFEIRAKRIEYRWNEIFPERQW